MAASRRRTRVAAARIATVAAVIATVVVVALAAVAAVVATVVVAPIHVGDAAVCEDASARVRANVAVAGNEG